jgi:magnesium transporter
VVPFRKNLTVAQALSKIRDQKPHFTRHLFAVDDQGRLEGLVSLQALALADRRTGLSDLVRPIATFVDLNAPRDEILRKLEDHKITDLPVVDLTGRLVGVIQYDALVETLQEESTIDLQTMMGVSRDERALSRASFAIKNRLPWLHINLLTAFLAAAVVGLFEGTIARFTALAVLLPVVAGQSGNTGSQALAVTLRGLAMREISVSYWVRVLRKEMTVGLVNGFAVAFTTSLGVFLWSRSAALSAVIGSAMVISMVAAVLAGAGIPILLTKMNQDPATSSSIILTTVTDVVGFFTFLGIATLMSGYLG